MREPTEAEVWDRAQAKYTQHRRLWNNYLPEWGHVLPSIRLSWRDRAREELLREMNACQHTCPKCEASPSFVKDELPPPPTPPTPADELAALERELVNVKAERDIAVREAKSARKERDGTRGPNYFLRRERDAAIDARDQALKERDAALAALADVKAEVSIGVKQCAAARRERDAARQDQKIAEAALSGARKARDRYCEELKEANRRIEIQKQTILSYQAHIRRPQPCQELEADRDNWRDTAIRRGEELNAMRHDLARTQQRLAAAESNAEHWREDALKYKDQAEARLDALRKLEAQRKECDLRVTRARQEGRVAGAFAARSAVNGAFRLLPPETRMTRYTRGYQEAARRALRVLDRATEGGRQ